MKYIDIHKGQLEKVYLIYYQYITLPSYYASNTEWVFNYREALLFSTQEQAKYNIERLREYENRALELWGIDPQCLKIESRYMVVSDYLIFQKQ